MISWRKKWMKGIQSLLWWIVSLTIRISYKTLWQFGDSIHLNTDKEQVTFQKFKQILDLKADWKQIIDAFNDKKHFSDRKRSLY